MIQTGESIGSSPTHQLITQVKSSLTYWEKLLERISNNYRSHILEHTIIGWSEVSGRVTTTRITKILVS